MRLHHPYPNRLQRSSIDRRTVEHCKVHTGHGRTGASVLSLEHIPRCRLHLPGDLIGEIMVNKGVLRAVIDGTVRDAETLATQGLVVFA